MRSYGCNYTNIPPRETSTPRAFPQTGKILTLMCRYLAPSKLVALATSLVVRQALYDENQLDTPHSLPSMVPFLPALHCIVFMLHMFSCCILLGF